MEILNDTSRQVLFRATGRDDETMRAVFVGLRAVVEAKIQVRLVDGSQPPAEEIKPATRVYPSPTP